MPSSDNDRRHLPAAPDTKASAVVTTDADGNVAGMNAAAERLTGWLQADAIGLPLCEVFRNTFDEGVATIETLVTATLETSPSSETASSLFLTIRQQQAQSIHCSCSPSLTKEMIPEGAVLVFDNRKNNALPHDLFTARLELLDFAERHSTGELLTRALDIAGFFVASPLGFFHFIEDDQRTIALQQWSSATMNDYCRTDGNRHHYSIDEAGIWADCVREKRPVVHNDYPSHPGRKGLPDGHVPIIRELVVPVIRGDKVVGIMGVGNKESSYTRRDIELVSYFADVAWEIIDKKRAETALARQREIESSMADLAALLLTAPAIEDVSAMILDSGKHLTGSRFGFVGSVEQATGKLVNHTMTRDIWDQCDVKDKTFVFEHFCGLWGWVLEHRQAIMSNDPAEDPRSQGTPSGHVEITGFLGAPALLDKEVLGIVALANPKDRFTQEDLTVARRLATLYALALHRHRREREAIVAEQNKAAELDRLVTARTLELAQANQQLRAEIAERQRAEELARENHLQLEVLAAILNNTPLILVFFTTDGSNTSILDWNVTATRILGWEKEEVLGKNLLDFLPASESQDVVAEANQRLHDDEGPHNVVNRCLTRDGRTVLIKWFNNSFHDRRSDRTYVISLGLDITTQHEQELQLIASEERFRTVADFCIDWEEWRGPDGKLLYTSPSCEQITGFPRDAFLADPSLALRIVHPDDRRKFAHHLDEDHKYRSSHQLDFRIITGSGRTRWISHSCQPVYNEQGDWLGYRISNRDITDRINAQRKIEEHSALLQMVFNGITEPLLLLRRDGTILMMNAGAEDYFHCSRDTPRMRRCHELGDSGEHCRNCRILAAINNNTTLHFERSGLLDPRRTETVAVYPLSESGEYAGTGIVRISDITKERQIEKELAHAAKMISLGSLVSGVAHEINNPNNFIMLNINLVKDAWQSLRPIIDRYFDEHGDFVVAGLPYSEMREELPNLLTGIMAGSRRIQRIVGELKEFSLPGLEQTEETVSINTVARHAVSLVNAQIRKATNDFSEHYGNDLPMIRGNSQKLEQVVVNLLQNACQALPDPTRGIRLTTRHEEEKREVVIAIEDQGQGIDEPDLNRIMDPFFTTKRDIGGTGLGLSVSAKIIADHHGRIEVTSVPEKGSCFIVCLPAAPFSKKQTPAVDSGTVT